MSIMFICLQCFILHFILLLTSQKATVSASLIIESERVKNYSTTPTTEIERQTTEEGERKDKIDSQKSPYKVYMNTSQIAVSNSTDVKDGMQSKKQYEKENKDASLPSVKDYDSLRSTTQQSVCEAVTDKNSSESESVAYNEEILTESVKDPFPYQHNSFLKAYRSTCGLRKNTRLKIISGREAEPHSWPWIVGLYRARLIRENKTIKFGMQPLPFCGASLISPRHLITASHCVMNLSRGAFEPKHKWLRPEKYFSFSIVAKLGDHSTLYEEELSEENLVQEVMHFHDESTFLDNDISIIKLSRPVTFSRAIQPVCVPSSTYELPAGAKCMAVGWGSTNKSVISSSPVLKEDELTIMSLDVCRGFNPRVHDGQICAGGAHKTGGKGDSGGGLYCKLSREDDQWYLFGVTSIGTPTPGPTIFASVPPVSSWINKNVDE